jgi:hypothetical protein
MTVTDGFVSGDRKTVLAIGVERLFGSAYEARYDLCFAGQMMLAAPSLKRERCARMREQLGVKRLKQSQNFDARQEAIGPI